MFLYQARSNVPHSETSYRASPKIFPDDARMRPPQPRLSRAGEYHQAENRDTLPELYQETSRQALESQNSPRANTDIQNPQTQQFAKAHSDYQATDHRLSDTQATLSVLWGLANDCK